MKNKLKDILALSLLLTGCSGKQTYTFEVKEHYIATLTSEVQDETHDIYLAYCVRGANETFIEVPLGDTRTELNLVFNGYEIEYHIGDEIVSNNGWKLERN